MKKSILYFIVLFGLLAPWPLCGLTVERVLNFDSINRAVIYAKVIDISTKDAPCNAIKTEYQDNIIVLVDKWTKNDVGEYTPIDTIKVGQCYLFYIEKGALPEYVVVKNIFTTNDSISSFTKNPEYYFKVYNLIGDKILPLSKCKLDHNFIKLIIDGGNEIKFEGFVQ